MTGPATGPPGRRRRDAGPGTTRRGDVVLVAGVYVVPLLVAGVLLTLAGLGGLALALVAVEAVVVTATLLARRRGAAPARPAPSRAPWLVPLVMLGVLGGIVALAVLASHAG